VPRSSTLHAIALTALTFLPACAGNSPEAAPPAAPQSDADRLSEEEIEAIYRERIEAGRTRFTEADVSFMQDMIHHHAQAVEISRFAPDRTENRQIRTLAARIINAQQDEIGLMQRWLSDRGQPVPEIHEMGDRVMVHMAGGTHGMDHDMADMPGMLSREEVDDLRAAEDGTFDRLFLTYMIEHHQGAVTMVRTLFATDGAGQDEDVFRFASDVQVDQSTEVARMQRMLDAMPR
jgi:uncharacterized protein (DUF305 family)